MCIPYRDLFLPESERLRMTNMNERKGAISTILRMKGLTRDGLHRWKHYTTATF